MNVLFLDVDGVLNSGDYIRALNGKFDWPQNQMDPVAVARLNKVTDATGVKLVISSTWRLMFVNRFEQLVGCMRSYGITGEIIGATKEDRTGGRRGAEIQRWIDENPGVDDFLIIDDDSDMGELMPYLVKTKFQHGMTDEHMEKLIDHFGRI